ncbi:MAG: hypothetical protein WCT45_01465 [Candidatus Paceibacterota bacterium]|jgi:hypothetical protein
MKTILDHIEHVKGKPHHIRRQVAFGVAAFTSVLIALVWLVGNYAAGTFAIRGSSFAASTGAESPVITTDGTDTTGLAGAAAGVTSADVPAHIEIIDTAPPAAPAVKQSEQTILPF